MTPLDHLAAGALVLRFCALTAKPGVPSASGASIRLEALGAWSVARFQRTRSAQSSSAAAQDSSAGSDAPELTRRTARHRMPSPVIEIPRCAALA
jgi:hypothetical protein